MSVERELNVAAWVMLVIGIEFPLRRTSICARRAALLLALALECSSAFALSGTVISITDGDTLTVLDAHQRQHKVRLAEIDAPEKKQPFGDASKRSLSDLCFGKKVDIDEQGTDRYGRTIGVVTCGGVEANSSQVRKGMAWAYPKYVKRQSLFADEAAARSARIGLWSGSDSVPPWEWRAR